MQPQSMRLQTHKKIGLRTKSQTYKFKFKKD